MEGDMSADVQARLLGGFMTETIEPTTDLLLPCRSTGHSAKDASAAPRKAIGRFTCNALIRKPLGADRL